MTILRLLLASALVLLVACGTSPTSRTPSADEATRDLPGISTAEEIHWFTGHEYAEARQRALSERKLLFLYSNVGNILNGW